MENIISIWPLIIYIVCLIFPIFHMIHSIIIICKRPYYLTSKLVLAEKPMSILVPCYNEESMIHTTILGINRLNYKNYEYILINDGSNDHTFEMMEELLDLELIVRKPKDNLDFSIVKGVYRSKRNQRIIVIDKFNGGKADALNAGISYSSNELIITLDADSILDENALSIINRAFDDPKLVAAGGMVNVLQGRKFDKGYLKPTLKVKTIVKLQIAEYLRGFYIYKASLSKTNALSIISGAFGVFKSDVLIKVGGYRKTVGEDIDITLKIQQYISNSSGLKAIFIPEAICYTEVPETWNDLYKQRVRWQKAFIDCTVLYFKEFISNFYKNRLSFFFLVEGVFIGVICSYLAVLGYLSIFLFFNNLLFFSAYLMFYFILNFIYDLLGIIISYYYRNVFSFKDFLKMIAVIILDLFVFRLFTLSCTIIGSIKYFIDKEGWNKVARTGRAYNIEQGG